MKTISRATDAPFAPAPSDRLHNSGWGRPPEQYRTPAVGTSFTLDLPSMLHDWKGATLDDAHAMRAVMPRHKSYPSTIIARYARALATALDCPTTPADDTDVLRALETLGNAVAARGLIDGMMLSCQTHEKYKWLKGMAWRFVPTTSQLAAVLAAAAFSHGGLVLWGAQPSLGSVRPDYVIRFTWLRRHEAGASARDCWTDLASAPAPEAKP